MQGLLDCSLASSSELRLEALCQDLQDGEPAAPFKKKTGAGEEEKHADAINYENEEELVDYVPEVNKDLPMYELA